jgi:hypothetical protein
MPRRHFLSGLETRSGAVDTPQRRSAWLEGDTIDTSGSLAETIPSFRPRVRSICMIEDFEQNCAPQKTSTEMLKNNRNRPNGTQHSLNEGFRMRYETAGDQNDLNRWPLWQRCEHSSHTRLSQPEQCSCGLWPSRLKESMDSMCADIGNRYIDRKEFDHQIGSQLGEMIVYSVKADIES